MSATTRATTTYTHSQTQSHMWLGVCTRHAARAARHTHTYTHVSNPDAYPQARTRPAHTPHAHTPTRARVCVCIHTPQLTRSDPYACTPDAQLEAASRPCLEDPPSRPPTSSVAVHVPLAASHTRRVMSPLPLASCRPSGLHATDLTVPECPWRRRAGGGRAAEGGRGERRYTSHNHIHTQSHTVTHVVGGVHTTRGTSGTPYTHIHTRSTP